MSNIDNIDAKHLIQEIKSRPAIWDTTCENFLLKTVRDNAWEEVLIAVYPNYTQLKYRDKLEVEKQIKKKWKHLKDCFRRNIRNAKRNPHKEYNKYCYYDLLTFLTKDEELVNISKESEVNIDNSNSDDDYDRPIIKVKRYPAPKTSLSPRKRLKKSSKSSASITNTNTTRPPEVQKLLIERMPVIYEPIPDDDEDRLFLLSLIKDLKKIPEDFRLEAKCEIMKIIRQYKMVGLAQYTIDPSFTYQPVVKKNIIQQQKRPSESQDDDDSNASYTMTEYLDEVEEGEMHIELERRGKTKVKVENPLEEETLDETFE